MSATNPQRSAADPCFELKADSFTLPVIRLLGTDLEGLSEQLLDKVNQAPEFFQNSPVIIDLHAVRQTETAVDFALLLGLLRGYGIVPVGVRGGNPNQNEVAQTMELAILSERRAKPTATQSPSKTRPAPAGSGSSGARIITRPVRSGQRVYAAGGDLVVTAAVSSGAELLADGNIHVYGPLRGRALAGVKGNRQARIFCQQLQAELVSVAGHYRVSENLDSAVRSGPVQVHLDERRLLIEPL